MPMASGHATLLTSCGATDEQMKTLARLYDEAVALEVNWANLVNLCNLSPKNMTRFVAATQAFLDTFGGKETGKVETPAKKEPVEIPSRGDLPSLMSLSRLVLRRHR